MGSTVEAALDKPARRLRIWWVVAAAATLTLSVVYYVAPGQVPRRTAVPGERIVAKAKPTALSLPDGTEVMLSRDSTLSLIEARPDGATRLRVDRGSARFDVPQRAGGEFVVEARDVRVLARGTRFVVQVVDAIETRIEVSVERGRAEVQDRKGRVLSTLLPNRSWSMIVAPSPGSAP
jgi:ferric-dicitrate binding protein FerR (iron transport regulator)